MIGLDRLMKQPGVVAAGQFDDKGNIVRSVGEFPKGAMEQIAHICKRDQKMMRRTAAMLQDASDLAWLPMNGWMMWGGNYALCIVQSTGVIVDAARADFNQLMVDLFLPEPTGAKPHGWEKSVSATS